MKMLWLITIALLTVGLGLTACSRGWLPNDAEQSNPKKPSSATPSKAEIVRLQAIANNACSCESLSKTGEGANCWREYQAAVSKYAVAGAATACDPISETMDCFGDNADAGPCVSKFFSISGLPANVNPKICSEDEAQAVEAAGTAAYNRAGLVKDPLAAEQASNKAMIKVLLEIRNGKLHLKPASGKSCG